MTFTAAEDLARHIRFQADYDDGTTDVFAVPEATLLQGGGPAVLPIIAWEWQQDGYLKAGNIVSCSTEWLVKERRPKPTPQTVPLQQRLDREAGFRSDLGCLG